MGQMANELIEWREKDLERRVARQRAQIESAKLLTTLALTSAGALVASALQDGKSPSWKLASVILLGVAFSGVLLVLILDRTTQVDHEKILANGREKSDAAVLSELRDEFRICVENNEIIIGSVRRAAQAQVWMAVAASTSATIALLS